MFTFYSGILPFRISDDLKSISIYYSKLSFLPFQTLESLSKFVPLPQKLDRLYLSWTNRDELVLLHIWILIPEVEHCYQKWWENLAFIINKDQSPQTIHFWDSYMFFQNYQPYFKWWCQLCQHSPFYLHHLLHSESLLSSNCFKILLFHFLFHQHLLQNHHKSLTITHGKFVNVPTTPKEPSTSWSPPHTNFNNSFISSSTQKSNIKITHSSLDRRTFSCKILYYNLKWNRSTLSTYSNNFLICNMHNTMHF